MLEDKLASYIGEISTHVLQLASYIGEISTHVLQFALSADNLLLFIYLALSTDSTLAAGC